MGEQTTISSIPWADCGITTGFGPKYQSAVLEFLCRESFPKKIEKLLEAELAFPQLDLVQLELPRPSWLKRLPVSPRKGLPDLSMVAEPLWGLLLSLGRFLMGFLSGRSRPADRSWVKKRGGPQASNTHDVLGDLQSFITWSEEIKLDMSCDNPPLYELLGSLVFSTQPIEEGSVQTSFLGRTFERNLGRQLGCLLVQCGSQQQMAGKLGGNST